MKIVINSHTKSNIALQHLLDSLKDNEINYCDIIVVIGGHYNLNNYEIIKDENITYIHANHNSIDFTGLITLLELYNNTNEYYYSKLESIESNYKKSFEYDSFFNNFKNKI